MVMMEINLDSQSEMNNEVSGNIYKLGEVNYFDMSPGNLNWLPDEFFLLGGNLYG